MGYLRMTEEQEEKVVKYMKDTGLPNMQVAARFGVSKAVIQRIRNKHMRETVGDPKFKGLRGKWWGGGCHAQL